jgi:hypothetical protein
MNTRILVPVNWTLWGILLVVMLYWLVRVSTERTSSPEAGPGLGIFAVLFVLALLAGAGLLLKVAARRESTVGLITLTVILAWPLVFFIADPVMRANKSRRFADDEARVGDFKDATLASMARAIAANDSATLVQLLGGKRRPKERTARGTACSRTRSSSCVTGRVDRDQSARCSPRVPTRARRRWRTARIP